MELPFEYGELVEQKRFVNREADKQRLAQNLTGGLNTMLISPRRWGKSSLVKQVAKENADKSVRFCFIDLFMITNEQEFYQTLAREVIKASSTKLEEWVSISKTFLQKLSPKISIGTEPGNEFDINMDFGRMDKNHKELLDLAENIAAKRDIRLVICIDEFQNLARFKDPLLFQQRLRACWQHHKHATYCLYGSKKHMMIDIFQNKSMPFYKFGDIMFLQKIETDHWVNYICKQFKRTGKNINKSLAMKIVQLVKNHSYYVQQLAHLVWIRTETKAGEGELEQAVNDLLSQNTILFSREIEHLSNTQYSFLKALANEEQEFHSNQTITQYKLGSSSNVTRIKEALEKKEIIDTYASPLEFLDPAFELWFKKYILKN